MGLNLCFSVAKLFDCLIALCFHALGAIVSFFNFLLEILDLPLLLFLLIFQLILLLLLLLDLLSLLGNVVLQALLIGA